MKGHRYRPRTWIIRGLMTSALLCCGAAYRRRAALPHPDTTNENGPSNLDTPMV